MTTIHAYTLVELRTRRTRTCSRLPAAVNLVRLDGARRRLASSPRARRKLTLRRARAGITGRCRPNLRGFAATTRRRSRGGRAGCSALRASSVQRGRSSTDIVRSPTRRSSTLRLRGDRRESLKVLAWYDNDWGYRTACSPWLSLSPLLAPVPYPASATVRTWSERASGCSPASFQRPLTAAASDEPRSVRRCPIELLLEAASRDLCSPRASQVPDPRPRSARVGAARRSDRQPRGFMRRRCSPRVRRGAALRPWRVLLETRAGRGEPENYAALAEELAVSPQRTRHAFGPRTGRTLGRRVAHLRRPCRPAARARVDTLLVSFPGPSAPVWCWAAPRCPQIL